MKTILSAIALAVILIAGPCYADTVTLAWDQISSASGYKIYYGTATNKYTTNVDVGNVLTYSIDVPAGTTYYFAATAYSSDSRESGYSNEVSYTVLPLIANVRLPVGIATVPSGAVITWDSFTGASGYKIKYGTTSGTYTVTLDAKTSTQYLLSGLANSTKYYVKVYAYSSVGTDVAKSAEIIFTSMSAPVLK